MVVQTSVKKSKKKRKIKNLTVKPCTMSLGHYQGALFGWKYHFKDTIRNIQLLNLDESKLSSPFLFYQK